MSTGETISFVDSETLHADCLGNYSKTSPNCLDECYTATNVTQVSPFLLSFLSPFSRIVSSRKFSSKMKFNRYSFILLFRNEIVSCKIELRFVQIVQKLSFVFEESGNWCFKRCFRFLIEILLSDFSFHLHYHEFDTNFLSTSISLIVRSITNINRGKEGTRFRSNPIPILTRPNEVQIDTLCKYLNKTGTITRIGRRYRRKEKERTRFHYQYSDLPSSQQSSARVTNCKRTF